MIETKYWILRLYEIVIYIKKKFIKNDDIITTELVPSKNNGLCNSVEHAEIVS